MQKIKLITRKQICALAGISAAKLQAICNSPRFKFPAPHNAPGRGLFTYKEHEVLSWLADNDAKAIKPDKNEYYRKDSASSRKSRFDNALTVAFLTGVKHEKSQAKPTKKTKTVHLIERNDYVPPSYQFSPQSKGSYYG